MKVKLYLFAMQDKLLISSVLDKGL